MGLELMIPGQVLGMATLAAAEPRAGGRDGAPPARPGYGERVCRQRPSISTKPTGAGSRCAGHTEWAPSWRRTSWWCRERTGQHLTREFFSSVCTSDCAVILALRY